MSFDSRDKARKMTSPEQIRPFPKAPPRKSTTNRRLGKSRILTKTPIKAALDVELLARAQKKCAKTKPKNVKVQPKASHAGMGVDPPMKTVKRRPTSLASSNESFSKPMPKNYKLADVMKALF